MLRKLLVLCVMAASTAFGAQAQAAGWQFVSVCSVPNGIDCPAPPLNVQHYGPFPTEAACYVAQDNVHYNSFFGRWPWTVSNCWYQ